MRVPRTTAAVAPSIQPDALLVERIAALADKAALAELDARHGMTLYAIAYSLLFDPGAADAAVAAAFREVWRWAGWFRAPKGTVRPWLCHLTPPAPPRAAPAPEARRHPPRGDTKRDLITSRS